MMEIGMETMRVLNDSDVLTKTDFDDISDLDMDVSAPGAFECAAFVCSLFMLVCCIVGVFGNAMSVLIFTRPVMRSSINVLLTGLSSIDLLMLATSIPVFVLPNFDMYFKETLLPASYLMTIIFGPYQFGMIAQTSSVWTFVLISFERYLAVCCPLKVSRLLSVRRARLALIGVIFAAIGYNIVRFFEYGTIDSSTSHTNPEDQDDESSTMPILLRDEKFYFVFYHIGLYLITHFLGPFLTITVLNFLIWVSISKSRTFRANLVTGFNGPLVSRSTSAGATARGSTSSAPHGRGSTSSGPPASRSSGPVVTRSTSSGRTVRGSSSGTLNRGSSSGTLLRGSTSVGCVCRKLHRRTKTKTTQMIVVVTSMFLCCNILPFVVNIWEAITPDVFVSKNPYLKATAFLVVDLSNTLVVFNSASTFLLYLLYCKKYRQLFKWYCLAPLRFLTGDAGRFGGHFPLFLSQGSSSFDTNYLGFINIRSNCRRNLGGEKLATAAVVSTAVVPLVTVNENSESFGTGASPAPTPRNQRVVMDDAHTELPITNV